MNIIARDLLCGYGLSARFIDGVKCLLDSGYAAKPHQLESYESLVRFKAKSWYEWIKSG
jgi:hypothetical protein